MGEDNYSNLVNYCMKYVENNIVLCSAVLPTIKNHELLGEVANLRKEVKESIKSRTGLTLSFNQSLRKLAENKNLFFLDMDSDLLDTKSGIVRSEFLHTNPKDHHLNPSPLSKIIYPKLIQFIYN